MIKKKLRYFVTEYSERNRGNGCSAVYSVTNSQGFVPSTEYFSKEIFSKDLSAYKIVKYGMMAYNPSRINVGSIAVQRIKDRVIVSPLYVVFSVNEEELLPEFLAFYLHSAVGLQQISQHTMGSVRDSLKFNGLQNIEINIYPIEQQRAIIEKLQKIEDIINKEKVLLKKLDALVKSQFIEMFGDYTTNSKAWDIVPLSDIADYFNGLTYKPENVVSDGIIVLRSSNIQNGELDYADIVRVDSKIKEKLYVRDGDILMCSRNGSAKLVGKVAQIKRMKEPATFGAFMMIIRTAYPEYLLTYFKMPVFREQIKTGATTTINQITSAMLDKIRLPLPPKAHLDEFAAFVEQTDKSKFRIKQSLEKLEYCYKVLLQKYFG